MTDGVTPGDDGATAFELADDGAAERPRLSVVIACLNAVTTLRTQLDALAAQKCPVPWELLICDNGSKDATVAVAISYRDRIPELRIIDASAVPGAGAARNHGARHALGTWLAFCDADDRVADDWLATMSAALAEHRFVAGRFEAHRLNGARVLRSRPLQQQSELQSSDIGAGLPHAGGGNMGIHREDFLALGGFDPAMPWLEDTDFSWRAQLAGLPLVFRPEVVVHVRLRQTFRAMFDQGRHYGMAHAVLERRYGATGPSIQQSSSRQPSVPTASTRPAARPSAPLPRPAVALTWLIDHFVGGRLAWRVGWVVGHRSRRARSAALALRDVVQPGSISLGSP